MPMKISTQRKQMIARKVRQQHGIELTPDEVERELNSAVSTVRAALIAKGYSEFRYMSSAEIYAMMKETMS